MKNDEFVMLTTAANETEAAMLRSILSDNGIDSYSKTHGMGSCYSISNLLSVDIYVSESSLPHAEELLSGLLGPTSGTCRVYLPLIVKEPIRRLKKHR